MSTVTFKFNILTAIVIVVACIALGYMIRKNYVNNKEIRQYEKQAKVSQTTIKDLNVLNDLRQDTINDLKRVINEGQVVIDGKNAKISRLNQKLATLLYGNSSVPLNQKYDTLIVKTGQDSLKKEYGFSGRQIGVLYDDELSIPVYKELISTHEGLQEALTYNLNNAQDETRIVTDQYVTCKLQGDEYKKIIVLKDQEVKKLKKQKKGRLWYSVGATTVATLTTILLLAK